ncbi:Stress responsive A/B Barrel Domain [Pseudobutyrivibrio sp. YE44]|uniref:Dabb family protein n=1 Tax=Pseudobutyrivibrio sp. YE44 TaxID=1520802 RepID=UPI00087F2BD1|nr:Dabb family protein [Pseudobutyrivibrio sp. YE44]SDB43000.1 Stress responsive A/B Barrel Domain [Pseudobutyrivibrio sp. YE44]
MRHYIIIKFKKDINWQSNLDEIRTLFNRALQIEEVNSIQFNVSNSDRDNRSDLMIEMNLSEKGLMEFDASDIHKEWKNNFGESIESKVIFDCE